MLNDRLAVSFGQSLQVHSALRGTPAPARARKSPVSDGETETGNKDVTCVETGEMMGRRNLGQGLSRISSPSLGSLSHAFLPFLQAEKYINS